MSRTLKDIAKELNISVSTVSRVVNNKEYVNEETRKRILKALDKYNYVPNQVARSLKCQATKTVGIIVPDISEDLFAQVIKGIDQVLTKKGYSIIVSDSNENSEKEEHYLRLLYQKRIDALVLATVAKEQNSVKLYIENGIPVVFIDNLPHLNLSYDSVLIDNQKASQLAVQHLIDLGHTDIAIIAGIPDETTGYERLEGYKKTLLSNGLTVNKDLIKYGNYKQDTGYSCMKELIENRDRNYFSAVYVTSEKMTFGAIKAIREFGLDIPRDISLVGFDFHDKSGLITPGITTIIQPESEIGKIVADLIIKRLKEKKEQKQEKDSIHTAKQKVMLNPTLIKCESTLKVNVQ